MDKARPKLKKVSDIVDQIVILRKEIEERQAELDRLNSLQLQESVPEPEGFDYKDAILEIFNEKVTQNMKIDDVVKYISSKYGFLPDRETVSFRISYLADSANPKRLERVPGKRGVYRLLQESKKEESESS